VAEDTPINAPLDSWLQVRGTVNERETGGVVPVIEVADWQIIPVPQQAYLILPGAVKTHP
jgi:uncharacterized membrane protein YcgQ (UPF0703/DUF1980 family)